MINYIISDNFEKLYPKIEILFIKKIKNHIVDALFPIYCTSCQKEGHWLCPDCQKRLEVLDFQECHICEQSITKRGEPCFFCRENRTFHLDGLVVATSYENPVVKKLVHNFKYRFIADVSRPLASLLAKTLIRNEMQLPDCITPVPLHPKRLRWRGYNQSFLLSQQLASELAPLSKIPTFEILERKKYTPPQMSIKKYGERLENVRDIFSIRDSISPSILSKKNILIIDDIATTGATLEECAKILKQAGARTVFGVVLARQKIKNK